MSGLGLADFLGHSGGGGGNRAGWLRRWKESGKNAKDTSIDIWLAVHAGFFPVWKTAFKFVDVKEDDRGVRKELQFVKFNSPEPEIVLANSNFRREKKNMATELERPPTECPFLLLREWLLLNSRLPDDAVIFAWESKRDDGSMSREVWLKADLTLENDRDKRNWRASITPKLSYLFTVADHENLGDGLVLSEESKLLADATKKVIATRMEQLGEEEGNPLVTPYAIRWKAIPSARNISDRADAMALPRLVLTDEIREVIESAPPDAEQYAVPREGDAEKIRAYMEAAAQVDLPFDELFSDDVNVRAALAMPGGRPAPGSVSRRSSSSSSGSSGRSAASSGAGGGQVQGGRRKAAEEPKGAPPSRRRRVEEKPPEPERIPCDDCGHPMLPTETVCPNCGAKYELDEPAAEPTPPPKTSASGSSKGGGGAATAQGKACTLCDGGPVVEGRCQQCGMDQDEFGEDDIPFD